MTFSGPPPPARFNMARYCLRAAAETRPEHPALIVVDTPEGTPPAEHWTYAQIERRVLAIAEVLRALGLRRGDRVFIRLDNSSLYAATFFGAIAGGFVPVPASSQLSGPEAGYIAGDTGAALIIHDPALPLEAGDSIRGKILTRDAYLDRVAAAEGNCAGPFSPSSYADTHADDPAFLVYTSGTTAHPKGVLHAQRSAWGRRPMYRGWYGLGPDDRMLHAGAFNWTYTLGTGLTDPWANGATSIVYTGPRDPAVWQRLIVEQRATMFAAVPGVFRQLLKASPVTPKTLGTLRHGLTAGETLPTTLQNDWRTATGRPLFEALGMSEISTYLSSGPDTSPRAGSVGRPQPGRSVAIIDPDSPPDAPRQLGAGEIGLLAIHRSDPALMLGYWDGATARPTTTHEAFRGDWFCGGDLAEIDTDGYVIHHGRADDIMNAQGYRVSPLEVEATLLRHPDVAEAAVVEIAVRDDLHLIGAALVAQPGTKTPPDDDALSQFAAQSLARYKLPRLWRWVPALPRTANGKVQRSTVRRTWQDGETAGT